MRNRPGKAVGGFHVEVIDGFIVNYIGRLYARIDAAFLVDAARRVHAERALSFRLKHI